MRRYETKSTMMTSNRPLEDWGKLIGDVPLACPPELDPAAMRVSTAQDLGMEACHEAEAAFPGADHRQAA